MGAIKLQVDDPCFPALVAGDGKLALETVEPLFHEAGVWLREVGEWLFTSNRLEGPMVKVHALHAETLELREVTHVQEAVPMANGGTSDGKGGVLLCSQGLGEVGGGIFGVCKGCKKVTKLTEQRFNSPNDVVLHSPTECILFTDPSYGFAQGFRAPPEGVEQHDEAIWCLTPDGATHLVDKNFVKPNGLCLSPDGATLYVTDSGYFDGAGGADAARPREVYAFDVVVPAEPGAPLAIANRRSFYRCNDGEGIPDGLKVDEEGRLFMGCGDGVHVCAPDGRRLGKLLVEGGAANLCFGGGAVSTLLILSEHKAITVPMQTRCGLHQHRK